MTSEMLLQVMMALGIGGAAMILRHRAGIFGFTTAAAVWLSAALGVGFRGHHLEVIRTTISKEPGGIRYTWQAVGRRDDHRSAMEELIHNDLVLEFTALQFDELS